MRGGFTVWGLMQTGVVAQSVEPRERTVVPGVTTARVVPGQPYALAGNRVVFANWYDIQSGDLD